MQKANPLPAFIGEFDRLAGFQEVSRGRFMFKLKKLIIAISLAFTFAVPLPYSAIAASIDLGGVSIRLPKLTTKTRKNRTTSSTRDSYSTSRQSSYSTHPLWQVVHQETHLFATNNQGIWIGYDDAGGMVLQLDMAVPPEYEKDGAVPIQVNVDGRTYGMIQGTVVSDMLIVAQGAEIGQILDRLMSGREVSVGAAGALFGTHLKGSSSAIREVRGAAALQARLFVQGKVTTTQKDKKEDDAVRYFLPGVQNTGEVEVRFDIVEDAGLVLYMQFQAISGHSDPAHTIKMTSPETKRAIALFRKAEEWTEVARKNRVGLFSKRLGFIDDVYGSETVTQADQEIQDEVEGIPEGSKTKEPSKDKRSGVGASKSHEENNVSPDESYKSKNDPKNFTAANFNSYEDGSTSVQVEHSVEGFSRRFNLQLSDALRLAESLEATMEYASFRLENRGFDLDKKDQLFQ